MAKKKDDLKNKIMQEEAVHAAFNSSDVRPVNKKVKAPNPGPGTYIDINNPHFGSIKSSVLLAGDKANQEEAVKLGAFGSNTIRSPDIWLKAKQGPDPGQYEKELVKVQKLQKTKYDLSLEGKSQASTRAFTAADKERSKINSVFMSTTDRFNNLESTHPNVRLLNPERTHKQQLSIDEGAMHDSLLTGGKQIRAGDKVQYDFKDDRATWVKRARAGDFEMFSGKNLGFDQTSPRFNYNQVFVGHSLKFDVPGPGQYPQGKRSDIAYTSQPKNRARLSMQGRPSTFQQPR
jgi:hypothetical protein